jgi:hypothetical protein
MTNLLYAWEIGGVGKAHTSYFPFNKPDSVMRRATPEAKRGISIFFSILISIVSWLIFEL